MDKLLLLLKQQILERIQLKFDLHTNSSFLFSSSPNFSFQNLIPTDELPNGASTTSNPPIENTTRRTTRRNDKNPHQQPFTATKSSFERTNHYTETRDRVSNQPTNKINRKQQHFNTNHYTQQANIQPSSHMISARSKS